jgi:hypothetical protein
MAGVGRDGNVAIYYIIKQIIIINSTGKRLRVSKCRKRFSVNILFYIKSALQQ